MVSFRLDFLSDCYFLCSCLSRVVFSQPCQGLLSDAVHSMLFPFAGIVNMTFPLSDQPVFGEWLIFAEMQGHTYNKSFEVQKYGELDPN